MALQHCDVQTDSRGKELQPHGAAMFPIACYEEDFTTHLVPWHWHEDFEIILVTGGCVHVHVESARVPVKTGEALFVNSGAVHSVNNGAAEDGQCRSLVFHPRLIGGGVDSVFWHKLVNPVLQSRSLRFRLLEPSTAWQAKAMADAAAAWQAVARQEDGYENEVRYLLSRAFYTMNASLSSRDERAEGRDSLSVERTKAMMRFIHESYAEELTLERIAASAAVSKSVCLRCFRQVIGMTPVRYLVLYRLEKAAELLLATPMKASEVATACGFSDISYFTKRFREWQGMTPVEYRRAQG